MRKLTAGYEMRCCYFEVFECARKIMLVGVPVFFNVGSVEQLTLGIIVCFGSAMVFFQLAPYEADIDDTLAKICIVEVFISLLSAIVLKTNPRSRTGDFLKTAYAFGDLNR